MLGRRHPCQKARFLGRDEEIDLLLRRWARAKAGDGQVVLISGEPGIGKSRITAEMEQRLRIETDRDGLTAMTAAADPLLAELWDNPRDAAYDQL